MSSCNSLHFWVSFLGLWVIGRVDCKIDWLRDPFRTIRESQVHTNIFYKKIIEKCQVSTKYEIFQNGFDRFVMFNRVTASEELALNLTSHTGPYAE